ncbi:MAG: hypothetical protein ACI8T1_001746 [Verrucomicrobiales bacterium]
MNLLYRGLFLKQRKPPLAAASGGFYNSLSSEGLGSLPFQEGQSRRRALCDFIALRKGIAGTDFFHFSCEEVESRFFPVFTFRDSDVEVVGFSRFLANYAVSHLCGRGLRASSKQQTLIYPFLLTDLLI